MTFTSLDFAVFFLIVIASRIWIGRTGREPAYLLILLLGSLLFYAWHVPWYLGIMLLTTIVHYYAGRYIAAADRASIGRRLVFVGAITASLALLATFKYANFIVDALDSGLVLAGLAPGLTHASIILPIGISFYTFHALSYTIDVYRGKTTTTDRFWKFLLYIAFFPQLVAGPIVRATEFLYQIERKRSLSQVVVLSGLYLCIRGFFFKLVVADNIASVVDMFWKSIALPTANPTNVLIVVFLFSMQIFADFLGYTDIARGVAYVLGFRLPLNFNYPYIASTFSDFWRRWHISLSSWLRDYLYVPLGGNRVSVPRTYANLLMVMLLGGLWHGAAYTFIIWGGIHGLALAIERALGIPGLRPGGVRLIWWLVVQCMVLVAWTFFRATSAGEAVAIVANLLSTRYTATVQPDILFGLLFAAPVVAIHARAWLAEQGWVPRAGLGESGAWAAAMVYLTLTAYGHTVSPFIYFQF